MTPGPEPTFDAVLPNEMVVKGEEIGVTKAGMSAGTLFVLAVLAGDFIALGAVFATTVAAGTSGWPTSGTPELWKRGPRSRPRFCRSRHGGCIRP
jgi:hypothetical protein